MSESTATPPQARLPDELLPLAAFASPIISLPTLRRWCSKGQSVRGTTRIVKLRVQRTPGKVYTCQRWLDEFLAHWNKGTDTELAVARPVLNRATRVAIAKENLRKMGMKI